MVGLRFAWMVPSLAELTDTQTVALLAALKVVVLVVWKAVYSAGTMAAMTAAS